MLNELWQKQCRRLNQGNVIPQFVQSDDFLHRFNEELKII